MCEILPSEWIKPIFVFHCRYVTELLGGEAYVSCSVVLPAICHLNSIMETSDDDPAYLVRFKAAFTKNLAERQSDTNNKWLRLATVLDGSRT